MRCKIFSFLISLFAIQVISNDLYALPVSIIKTPTPIASLSTHNTPDIIGDYERFLVALNNVLVRKGLLHGPMLYAPSYNDSIPTPAPIEDDYQRSNESELWTYVDARGLASALDAFFGPESGGFVSDKYMHKISDIFLLGNDRLGNFILSFPNETERYLASEKNPLDNCSLYELRETTPDVALHLGANLQCIAYRRLHNEFVKEGEDALFQDVLDNSRLGPELDAYLSSLVDARIIELGYSLDLENLHVYFQLTETAASGSTNLPFIRLNLESVNRFASTEAQKSYIFDSIYERTADAFTYLRGEGDEPIFISHSLLNKALDNVANITNRNPTERQKAFFNAFGLAYYFETNNYLPDISTAALSFSQTQKLQSTAQMAGAEQVQGCEGVTNAFQPGRITPCNKKVVVLEGFDWNGAFAHSNAFEAVVSTLVSMGYEVSRVNFHQSKTIRVGGFTVLDLGREFSKLRGAQTLFVEAHGAKDGSIGSLYVPDIKAYEVKSDLAQRREVPNGPTEGCCQVLKHAAIQLGLADHTQIRCLKQGQKSRDDHDPTDSLRIAPSAYSHGVLMNRCVIEIGPKIYASLKRKAAGFTAQCYGGRLVSRVPVQPTDPLPPLAPEITANFMDFISGSTETNWPTTLKADADRIAKDLKGESAFCHSLKPAASLTLAQTQEPWSQRAATRKSCAADEELIPSVAEGLMTVQRSATTRGSRAPFSEERTAILQHNASGWEQYEVLNTGGDSTVEVEFAPHIEDVLFEPSNGLFMASFSSRVKEGTVKVDTSQCPNTLIGTTIDFAESGTPRIGPLLMGGSQNVATFSLLPNNPSLMSDKLWSEVPEKLQKIYGHNQRDWPWYISVLIKASAPNGIAMVGNSGASEKWIWTDPGRFKNDAPWKFTNGDLSSGGHEFEARIPCNPPMICCLPNLEKVACKDSKGLLTYRYVQNGCNVVPINSLEDCIIRKGNPDDKNMLDRPGEFKGYWKDPCGGTSEPSKCAPTLYYKDGESVSAASEELRSCAEEPKMIAIDQYIERPYSDNKVENCPGRRCLPTPVSSPSPVYPNCNEIS